jgi:ATP synthase protein I
MKNHEKLKERVKDQVRRSDKAERERPTVIGQTVFLGTLGLLMVLPMVGGAYLGRWLDGMVEGYSLRWTLSLIFLGIIIGATNVYLFVRR